MPFVAVLFFTAMSQRLRNPRSQRLLLGLAIGLAALGVSYPTKI